jgi:uncharacterized ferredoxin-like protein
MELSPESRLEVVVAVAQSMCLAARTAPKAKGADNIVTAMVTPGAEVAALAAEMRSYGEAVGAAFFTRDAASLEASEVCVLLGTKLGRLGIPGCSFCGYAGCAANAAAASRCAYNIGDLGIAVGSAVSVAADQRVDSRVMYSVGMAAVRLGLLGPEVPLAFGIPLSVKGKSPFFDRG